MAHVRAATKEAMMKQRRLRSCLSAATTAALLVLAAPPVGAHEDEEGTEREELNSRRPEAWTMRHFAAATQSTGVSAPISRRLGSFELGLETDSIPYLSAAQRTVGFNGTKEEDLNRTPVIARPHAAIGLGRGFSLVADWVPPIRVHGSTANVVTVALERPLLQTDTWTIGARVGAGSGRLRGDFTCPQAAAAAGDDPVRNPSQCLRASDDVQSYHWKNVAVVVSHALTPSLQAYASASLWKQDAIFRVHALLEDEEDQDRLAFAGSDRGAALGLDWSRGLWHVGTEVFYSPLDVIRDPSGRGPSERDDFWNIRLKTSYRFR
ncbi:MAG TPA: hypothetical protein VGV61_12370 [Thermoanaerobaculia bacterium]|nr:hypothetical protein [Thermoanaerobaculia bacterium]